MEQKLIYSIDDRIISPAVIQQALDGAQSAQSRTDVLSEAFKMLSLVQLHERSPNDSFTKENIKAILDHRFVVAESQKSLSRVTNLQRSRLDVSVVYPLNKSGTFGRQLERSCKLEGSRVAEWQGKQPANPKVKDIRDFIDKIERHEEKGNNQLGWINKAKEYPYRIIFVDTNKNNKAIYFRTLQEAESVRMVYLNQLKVRVNVPKLIGTIDKTIFRSLVLNKFYQKLISQHRMVRKSMSHYSKNLLSDVRAENDRASSNVFQKNLLSNSPGRRDSPSNNRIDPIEAIFRKSNTKSAYPQNQGYDNKFLTSLLEKQDRLSASNVQKEKMSPTKMNFSVVYRIEQHYKRDLIVKWWQRTQKQIQKRLNQQREMENRRIQELKSKSALIKNPTEKSRSISGVRQNPISVQFVSIEFLKMNNIYFKPIVTIQLLRKEKVVYQAIFNTFLKRKSPDLLYKMIVTEGTDIFKTSNLKPVSQSSQSLKDYTLNLIVIDYLTNQEVAKDSISLKNRLFSKHTYITNPSKTVKLELLYSEDDLIKAPISPTKIRQSQVRGSMSPENVSLVNSAINPLAHLLVSLIEQSDPTGLVLQLQPLSEEIVKKITKYWEDEATKKYYYSPDAKVKIIEILELGSNKALWWWMGIDEQQYNILSLLNTASEIIGFRILPSFMHIVRAMKQLYSDLEELIESILSVIVNYASNYYFPENLNRINKFHTLIGLDANCDFASKVSVQMSTLERLIEIECPTLHQKFKRRNICYSYQLYEYIYELFSRNLPIKVLVQVWNFCFKNREFFEMYMLLLGVWLVRHYELKLRNCRRNRQVKAVLESFQIANSELIIRQLLQLRDKYFQRREGLVSQIKSIFASKPLQKVLFNFYRQQTNRIDSRKENREIEKKTILNKFNSQKIQQFALPIYGPRKYCFHIYFYTVPLIPGSLYLKTEGIQYECIAFEKKRYYIISEVNAPISLEFIDNKSNEYTCQIEAIQGINCFKSYLQSGDGGEGGSGKRSQKSIQIQYLCGLLTQNQIDILKKNKKFQHYLGPFMGKQDLRDELLRPVEDALFLREADRNKADKEDLSKKIKVLFSQGSRAFNEIQFYLRWIESTQLSLAEKIELVRQFSANLSRQYFLSHNRILEKMMVQAFLQLIDFPLTNTQFQCFYNDSSDCEFDCPKIIKCRFLAPNGKQVKLEQEVVEYVAERASKYLYGDIIIEDLLNVVRPKMEQLLGTITEGNLLFLYSSYGQLHFQDFKIRRRKNNKELFIDLDEGQQIKSMAENISLQQPEVLMTEVLPTFSKITTILDFVNNNKSPEVKIPRIKPRVAENINILKSCQQKFDKVVSMRYYQYPQQIQIPFLNYYYDLVFKVKSPEIPTVYINNTKSDIKSICTSKMAMQFSENKRGQNFNLQRKLGLYGNLRKLTPASESAYFWTYRAEQQAVSNQSPKCYVFINYGYGVFRWESCQIKGYRLKIKERISKAKQKGDGQPKKEYLIQYKNSEFFAREYEVRISPEEQEKLTKIDNKKLATDRSDLKSQKNNSSKNMQFLSKFIH